MRVAGVICEYNPFHNGHMFHITETRRLLGEDTAVICLMSGNFVQRGEPAVLNKHIRAAAAVMDGADLVLELPVQAALSSAEGFALGGIDLLNKTGICTHLSFGSECGSVALLYEAASCLLKTETDMRLKEYVSLGLSYAVARQKAAEDLMGDGARVLSSPNNNLGVEYCKAILQSGSSMIPLSVLRTGEHDFSSCSGLEIRRSMLAGSSWEQFVPARAAELYKKEMALGRGPVCLAHLEQTVLYRLRSMKQEEFSSLPGGGDGLGEKLWKAVQTGNTLEEIMTGAKSKRHAMSRIRRLILSSYLHLTEEDMQDKPGYIRVLAIGERGRELLKKMKNEASLPVVVRPSEGRRLPGDEGKQFVRDALLTDFYVLAYSNNKYKTCGGDYRYTPFICKKEENDSFEDRNI